MKKIGIFFGGRSREREISFGSGRTIYDNIDKEKYIPVPIFLDSLGNFILLQWNFIYRGSILDFLPDSTLSSTSEVPLYLESYADDERCIEQQISNIGKKIHPHDFSKHIDFAFLTLHGKFGEDGLLQSILEWYNIPYSGSKVLGSAIGINKMFQKKLLAHNNFLTIADVNVDRNDWVIGNKIEKAVKIIYELGHKLVIKSNTQGSSIGISAIRQASPQDLKKAIDKSFFIYELSFDEWNSYSQDQKSKFLNGLADIIEGLSFPILANKKTFYKPQELGEFIENYFTENSDYLILESLDKEENVVVEKYIDGREFSCIVLQKKSGETFALPPTELIKSDIMLSYSGKYLPGATRKETPIDLPIKEFSFLCHECIRAFKILNFGTYARIDGIISKNSSIFINDPNTTAGMLPSSFLFNQAAEIGLSPKQLISFIIEQS